MSYHIARRLADPSSPTAPSLIYRLYLVARCAPTRGDVSRMHSMGGREERRICFPPVTFSRRQTWHDYSSSRSAWYVVDLPPHSSSQIPLLPFASTIFTSTTISSIMNSAIVSPNDTINIIAADLPEEDDFNPTEWTCSTCKFLNNDDESCCQNIDGGNICSTRRHSVMKTWDSTSFAKCQVSQSQTGSSLHSIVVALY